MLDGSTVLTYESEDAKMAALDALEETPENEAKIDAIMNAEIKTPGGDGDTAELQPEPTPEPKPAPEPEKAADTSPPDFMAKLKEKGFDSVGKFLKSYDEGQSLIERQQRFINEKLDGGGSRNSEVDALKSELAEVRKQLEAGKIGQTPTERQETNQAIKQIQVGESKLARIKELRAQIAKADDPFDDDVIKARNELEDLSISEMDRLSNLSTQLMSALDETRTSAMSAQQLAERASRAQDAVREERKRSEALANEYREMDSFSQEYPEFAYSKDPSTGQSRTNENVDAEYIDWAQKVAKAYYGQPVSMYTEKGKNAAMHALNMLKAREPSVVEACGVMGVSLDPSPDVQKYLDLCELLDFRDGIRKDSVTGKVSRITRYDPKTNTEIPSVMSNLKAAYEYRKVMDGTYAKKIQDAYRAGSKDAAEAASRRASGVEELDNTTGASSQEVGTGMTQEQALKVVESIEPEVAQQKLYQGDPSDMQRLKEAMKVLQILE